MSDAGGVRFHRPLSGSLLVTAAEPGEPGERTYPQIFTAPFIKQALRAIDLVKRLDTNRGALLNTTHTHTPPEIY